MSINPSLCTPMYINTDEHNIYISKAGNNTQGNVRANLTLIAAHSHIHGRCGRLGPTSRFWSRKMLSTYMIKRWHKEGKGKKESRWSYRDNNNVSRSFSLSFVTCYSHSLTHSQSIYLSFFFLSLLILEFASLPHFQLLPKRFHLWCQLCARTLKCLALS